MIYYYRIALVLSAIGGGMSLSVVHAQQPDPNSPRYKGVVALSDFLTSQGDEALDQFVEHRVSRQLRDSIGQERLASVLNQLRSDFTDSELSGARPEGPFAAYIEFSNGKSISFEMEADPPHRFVRLGSIGGKEPSGSAVCCATPSQQSGVSSFAKLDEKLRAEAAAETFSGVVLVAKDGEPIFHEAYGFADKAAGVANRKDTKFNLGSINKLFTMVAVYQLLDEGKLSLDDTIGKYLPQFPSSVADSVTIRHLLDHRSGWAAYWDNPTWNARRAELRSLDDYMAFIKDIPLDFEPGSRQQYSNTGYEVLGAIVQKASGQSYYDYVRDQVYTPAGMMDTDAYERDGNTPNMAIGYAGGGYGEDNSSMLAVKGTAAGGGFSTAADLMEFAKAIDKGNLIPKKYANRLRGGGCAGGGPGVNATLEMSVAGNHTVVVLSNFDPPTATRIAREIVGMLGNNVAAETGVNRYRIGVGLEVDYEGGIAVSFLIPDAPGERGGLEPDDVILAINGKPITNDPIGQIDAVLVKPDPIQLKVRRGDSLKYITITPERVSASTAPEKQVPRVALETKAGALEQMISASGDASLRRFIDKHLSATYRASVAPSALLDRLKSIRSTCARAGTFDIRPLGDTGIRLTCGGGNISHAVDFHIEPTPPYGIVSLEINKVDGPSRGVEIKPITWENLKQRLNEEERAGFSGAVVVVRNGEVVLNKGYGQADRERGVANTSSTLFAIGSIPIDFTRAAVLKLEEMGRLETSDRITKYFPDVPEDKQGITLDQLMTGKSGLPNFHEVPGQDDDYDLTWINRETAVRRIFAKELLFPPGEGRAHSHSAWVLLAAVVEVASMESYGDFLQNHFFQTSRHETNRALSTRPRVTR